MKKLLVLIAKFGQNPNQKEILGKLSSYHKSFFRAMAEERSKDEDYTRANMVSLSFGAEVLQRQVEREKKEEAEVNRLINEGKKAGISEWRINLAK